VVDANVIVGEYLAGQSQITSLLGTNAGGSIYYGYDLPEHFDPTLGQAIQIYRVGGHSHTEITVLVDARLCIRVWSAVEDAVLAAQVYSAIHDALHGLCGYSVADGTIVRALEVTGPLEMTDPDTGWVAEYAFYQVMIRPLASSSLGPSGIGGSGGTVGIWYQGEGAPTSLEVNGDYYLNLATGDIYLQASGSWGVPVGNIQAGGGGGGGEVASLVSHTIAAASTNAKVIKAAPGTMAGWECFNDTEYPIYVKLYDSATLPNVGVDTPKQVIPMQGQSPASNPPGPGIAYENGIAMAIVTGLADSSNSAVIAGSCVVDIFYQ
jgi:hypothetical protein